MKTDSLIGKYVFIYFSSCPPCRDFTPVLAEFHKAFAKQCGVVHLNTDGGFHVERPEVPIISSGIMVTHASPQSDPYLQRPRRRQYWR